MNINGKTDIYALIGNNISHSLSPFIQNFLIKNYKLNAVYIPIELKNNLNLLVELIKNTSNFKGCNITIPYKETAFKLSDEVSEEALSIKTVNTLKKENNKITAVNTDSYGFLRALKEDLSFSAEDKNIVIIGSGGTAKTIIYSLVNKAKSILVLSRKKDNIVELLENFPNISWNEFKNNKAHLILPEADLIVNATPLGLNNEIININFNKLKNTCSIFDVLYIKSPLIKLSEEGNIQSTNGLNMLIYQGIKSFQFWHNIIVETDIIKKLKDLLNQKRVK
jgi:shikimate dehydrogenase